MVNEGAGGSADIRNLVQDSLREGGQTNEPLTAHDKILEDSEQLRKAIAKEANVVWKERDGFNTALYLAAYQLNSALSYLLDESTAISKHDPETGSMDNTDSTAARENFVNKISQTLAHLGMDGAAAKEALIKSGDVNE